MSISTPKESSFPVVWYVSPAGSDTTGNGTEANPFASVKKAIGSANSGHGIKVLPGTYRLIPMPIDSYRDVGIYDAGKDLYIWGTGPDTILEFYGADVAKRDANVMWLASNSTVVANLTFHYYPNKSAYYSNAVFVGCNGTIRNCHIENKSTTTTMSMSYYNSGPANAPAVYNCTIRSNGRAYIYDYSGSPLYVNCLHDFTIYLGTRQYCIQRAITANDSIPASLPADLKNAGDPMKYNPDDTRSNVGVCGGEYAWGYDPPSQTALRRISSVGISSVPIGCLAHGAGNIYASNYNAPSYWRQVKSVELMTLFGSLLVSSGAGVYSVECDGTYFYSVQYTSGTSFVYKRNLSLGDVSYVATGSYPFIRVSKLNNGYLYYGRYTAPARFLKVRTSDLAIVNSSLTLNTGEDNCTALTHDGEYLYAGLYTSPAKIVRINADSMTRVDAVTLGSGEDYCWALSFAGGYLYAGLGTSPAKIVKINPVTMTKVATLTLDAGNNECRALTYNDVFLYAGLYTDPAKIVRIDIEKFQVAETLTLAPGEKNCQALIYDDMYLYAGADKYLVKIQPFSDLGGGQLVYGEASLSGSTTVSSASTRIRTDSADLLTTYLFASRPGITRLGAANLTGTGNVIVHGLRLIVPTGTHMITKDDYFRKSQPAKYEKLVNYVEVYTNPLVPAATAEKVYETNNDEVISLEPGESKIITVMYEKKPVVEAVVSLVDAGLNVFVSGTQLYAWGGNITIENNGAETQTCKIQVDAKPLSVQGKELIIAKDDASITEFGTMKYTFPDNDLIQTRAMAQQIANKLLATFKNSRMDINLDWRGNPALLLSDIIYAPEYQGNGIESWGNFYTTKQEIDYDGTLRAKLEGRKT